MPKIGNIPWNKGLKNWRPNYKPSEETKRKIGLANSVALKGKKLTIIHKEKIKKSLIGRVISEEWKKRISEGHKGKYFGGGFKKGHKHSKKTKLKLSIAHKGQVSGNKGKHHKYLQGKNHHNWKGGITPLTKIIRHSYKYRQWICDVFTRDDYTCQVCNKRGGYLHAHHLKEFFKILENNNIKTIEQALNCQELWNINNGQTLCKKCHNKIPRVRILNED